MRAQSVIGIVLGALATAALAQVAVTPLEQKGGNVQADADAPAGNQAAGNEAAPANSAAPKNEAVAQPEAVTPTEPKR